MNILSIESSCDETAAAVIAGDLPNAKNIASSPSDVQKTIAEPTPTLLSNVVVSQIDIFKEYGGVIPEVAARNHLDAILPVIHKALDDAGKTWDDIDAIAVTHTPGLLGSLLIGTLTARTLAILHDKPLYPIHHLKSHIYANWLGTDRNEGKGFSSTSAVTTRTARRTRDNGPRARVEEKPLPSFPLLALVISGGHTQILYMPVHNSFDIIGTTRDDAVGECFDKVAKILGLPYPGGPSIANAAAGKIPNTITTPAARITISPGDPNKYQFPHPKLTAPARPGNGQTAYSDTKRPAATDSLDFSFSGLKTAVLRKIQEELNLPLNHPSYDLKNHLSDQQIADFAASFQKTAIDILLENLEKAYRQHPEVKSLVIAGGVSANQALREETMRRFPSCFFPEAKFSGDNAAMVGAAAFYEIASGKQSQDPYSLNILPRSAIN